MSRAPVFSPSLPLPASSAGPGLADPPLEADLAEPDLEGLAGAGLAGALASARAAASRAASASEGAASSQARRPAPPMPRAARILVSISLASSGLSLRKVRAFSLPWPSWSDP